MINNLTSEERMTLYELRNSKDIVIKKADKSITVAVINRDDYIADGIRQLSTDHYEEIEEPDIESIHKMFQEKGHKMHRESSQDKITIRYLTNKDKKEIRSDRMYLLPEIHKWILIHLNLQLKYHRLNQ